MRGREIFRFEFGYQVRRPWPWLFFAVLVVVSFLMTRDASVSAAMYDEFIVNSPFNIAKTTVFGSLIWLLVAAVIAGEAGARDIGARMFPLVYTTPLKKSQYLGGRFAAALALNLLMLLGVQLGVLIAVYSPDINAAQVGPFRPAAYLTAYAFLSVPSAFVATALQFAFAVRSGRAMASYAGSMLLIFFGFFVASLLAYDLEVGKLLDPIGIRFVVEDMARMWTPLEKNVRLMSLEGELLANRAVWVGVGAAALVVMYAQFRFAQWNEREWFRWARKPRSSNRPGGDQRVDITGHHRAEHVAPQTGVGRTIAAGAQAFGFASIVRQLQATTWTSFKYVATSWTGLFLLLFIPLLSVAVIADQMQSDGGVLVPTTARVLHELTAPISSELSRWVIVPLLIVFFAGELVWRERESRAADIVDSMPVSDWMPLVGKFLGLSLVIVAFLAMQLLSGIVAQSILGYQQFELPLYFKILFGLQLSEYLLFVVPALVVHVLVNQKYVGHLVGIMVYVFMAVSSLFGIEHNMLVFGASPAWTYTNMRGFGPTLAPALWFKLYWAAWGLVLAVVAKLFWPRGRETSLPFRLRQAQHRLRGATLLTSAVALVLLGSIGGFVFYNTNILNEYLTTSQMLDRRAEYERLYGKFAGVAQPELVATKLRMEIYPDRRALDVRGSYRLVNRTAASIDSIHVATARNLSTGEITFDRTVSLAVQDDKLGHRVYALQRALEPGESLQMEFHVAGEPRGFTENGVDASVAPNGSYFLANWLPAIGYQDSREILLAADRRNYGLPPQRLIHSLYDTEARKDKGLGISFEAIVGTSADQVAVAPGTLRREWTENGRKYFEYASDGTIGSEWAFFSAKYEVHEELWKPADSTAKDVVIRIYHQPGQTQQLPRMIHGVRSALDYYSREFGPYRYNHLSIVERPGEGTGLHADASMITHSEGFGLWRAQEDSGSLDFPSAVLAHEMAHQWTVPYAFAEGAPVMSESIAWYYAMKLFEHDRGPDQRARLLGFMRQPAPYPPIKRGEPLLRGLDPYMSYRRGPFALYALSEYVGEAQVNRALRTLLATHRADGAPLATTLDLYAELKAVTPDSLQYLLRDLVEVNTFWDLRTTRASVSEVAPDSFQVTLTVRARKTVVDTAGKETEVPMNDLFEIGVYDEKDDRAARPMYLQKHRVRAGEQTITVIVPRRPARAGIDPRYLLLTDLERDDNVRRVDAVGR